MVVSRRKARPFVLSTQLGLRENGRPSLTGTALSRGRCSMDLVTGAAHPLKGGSDVKLAAWLPEPSNRRRRLRLHNRNWLRVDSQFRSSGERNRQCLLPWSLPTKANKTVFFLLSFYQGATQSGILFLVSIERGSSSRGYHRPPSLSDMSQLGGAPCRFIARPGCGARRCRRTDARKGDALGSTSRSGVWGGCDDRTPGESSTGHLTTDRGAPWHAGRTDQHRTVEIRALMPPSARGTGSTRDASHSHADSSRRPRGARSSALRGTLARSGGENYDPSRA
jgi:hypothetical protein